MKESDEILRADSSSRLTLTCAPVHVNCTEPYGTGERSMNSESSRLGLILVGEPSETTCSHRTQNRIRRGIVWQAAYGAWRTHPESVTASPQRSNHSEHVILSSSPMTPHTP